MGTKRTQTKPRNKAGKGKGQKIMKKKVGRKENRPFASPTCACSSMVFFLCALKDALWGWGFRPNLPAALQEQITPSECGMGIYRL